MQKYIIICTLHLALMLFGAASVTPYTKVLLMPILALSYYQATQPKQTQLSILIALLFSCLGDTLLLFTDRNPNFFLLGLASFFIAHAFYIYTFVKNGTRPTLDILSIVVFIGAIANLGFMLSQLLPVLPDAMPLPVIAYGTILTAALCATLYLSHRLQSDWKLLLCGVILFVISDSLIAFNRFLPEMLNFLPNVSFWIMLTYVAAQGLIIKSIINLKSLITNN
jgi:uncharacterized membrane protein YhhN